jgi:hypothetical protein
MLSYLYYRLSQKAQKDGSCDGALHHAIEKHYSAICKVKTVLGSKTKKNV